MRHREEQDTGTTDGQITTRAVLTQARIPIVCILNISTQVSRTNAQQAFVVALP